LSDERQQSGSGPRASSLAVVVLQYGGGEMTCDAVTSFRAACGTHHELVIVDNASPADADREAVAALEGVRTLFLSANLGFGAGNNRGAAETEADVLLFLNNDTLTTADFVTPVLEAFARDPEIGIIGPAIANPDGTPQLSHGRLPSIGREAIDRCVYRWVDAGHALGRRMAARHIARRQTVEWVTGAALFIRRELFAALGGFDEEYFLYFEDKDLCARCRQAGRAVVFLPVRGVTHVRGGSAPPQMHDRMRAIYRVSQRRYYARHRPAWEQRALKAYQALTG